MSRNVSKHLLTTLAFCAFLLTSCDTSIISSSTSISSSSASDKKPEIDSSIEISSEEYHEHTFSSYWESDETYHWHPSTCGHDVIDGKGEHTFKKEIDEPTYEHEGYITYTCSACGYWYSGGTIPALEHHYNDEWSFDDYSHYHACIDEGYETEIIDWEAHQYVVEQVIEPTFEREGYTIYRCEKCGHQKEGDYTERLTHTYSDEWSYPLDYRAAEYHYHACVDKGYEYLEADRENHRYKKTFYEATFDRGSYTHYECIDCGYSYDDESNPFPREHNYDSEWTYGETNHWHKCIDEGYEDLISDFSEHSLGTDGKEPDFESGGFYGYSCSYCGYIYIIETYPPLEHSYSYTWSYNENQHWHACTDEGYEDLKTQEGDHDFVETVIPPTYAEDGYTLGKCSVCGYSYHKDEVDALPITIIWSDEDETILQTGTNFPYGELPQYTGTPCAKDNDAYYTYSFAGWDPEVVAATEDATYKATYQATPIEYTIQYSLDGGATTNPTSYSIASDTIVLSDPEKTGYTFLGWTGSNGDVPQKDITIEPNRAENLSFTANWEKTTYQITYDLDGGTNDSQNTATYQYLVNIAGNDATKTGYKFDGWFIDESFETALSNVYGYAEDLTLYAKFTPLSFKITLDDTDAYRIITFDRGDSSPWQTKRINVGESLNIYDSYGCIPSRDGYIFDGWFDDKGTLVTKDYLLYSDITLYAHWVENPDGKYQELGFHVHYGNGGFGTTKGLVYIPSYYGEVEVNSYVSIGGGVNVNAYQYRREASSTVLFKDVTTNKALVNLGNSRLLLAGPEHTTSNPTYGYSASLTLTLIGGHEYSWYVYADAEGPGCSASADLQIDKPTAPTIPIELSQTWTISYDAPVDAGESHHDGYIFNGWYDENDEPMASTWVYLENKTFHAVWVAE